MSGDTKSKTRFKIVHVHLYSPRDMDNIYTASKDAGCLHRLIRGNVAVAERGFNQFSPAQPSPVQNSSNDKAVHPDTL